MRCRPALVSPKITGLARGMTGVFIGRILENLFDFFLAYTVLAAVLHVSIGIVVEIPNNRVERHKPNLRLLYYNTTQN